MTGDDRGCPGYGASLMVVVMGRRMSRIYCNGPDCSPGLLVLGKDGKKTITDVRYGGRGLNVLCLGGHGSNRDNRNLYKRETKQGRFKFIFRHQNARCCDRVPRDRVLSRPSA